ncbi:hypothetical protein FRB99_002159 [Tulasnella sp. 403]|nr:hypothetical protein FRB99_002159 [Tulasnella sp. 403]
MTTLNHPPERRDEELDLINQLPPELLIYIFFDVLALSGEADRFYSPFKLGAVSRRWRELCFGVPRLWTYTFHGGRQADNKLIALQLARSASLPLDVVIHWLRSDHDEDETYQTVRSLAGRVRSLKLQGFSSSDMLLSPSKVFDMRMFPLLEDAELRITDSGQIKSFLSQPPPRPQLQRLYLSGPFLKFPRSALPYQKLTVLILHGCTTTMKMIRRLFQGMPQIEAFQLLWTRGKDRDGVAPTILAPRLRRFCVMLLLSRPESHGGYSWCWGVRLIQALEAPELRELMYGVEHSLQTAVRITPDGENWGAKFPKLDALGLCGVWLDDGDLRETLRSTSTGLQKFSIWQRKTTSHVAKFVDVLTELVERGELARLGVVDLKDVDVNVLYEGLKGRKKWLPLKVTPMTVPHHLMSPDSSDQDLDFINRLPPELLIDIYLDVFVLLDKADRFICPFDLAQVCRPWRELCLATPYLWTYTFHGGRQVDNKLIPLQLARSANLPLDVAIRWIDGSLDHNDDETCRIMSSLVGRGKSLRLHGWFSLLKRLGRSEHLNITVFPLLEDAELHITSTTAVTSFLSQHPSCSRLKRLYLQAANLEFAWSSLRYQNLTVLILCALTISMESIGQLFLEMPQIEAFQLLRVDGRYSVVSTIVAPNLRRFCVVRRVSFLDADGRHAHLWGMRLIRAIEAPELRELMYGLESRCGPGVHITHGGENWGLKFPKLDTLGLWGVWLEGEDLREMLRVTSTGVQNFVFWMRGNKTNQLTNFLNVLTELVEQGELTRLEVVDLIGVDVGTLLEGLKGREKRLPLRVRIDSDGLMVGDVDGLKAQVKEIIELEVCIRSRASESYWMY